MTAPEPHPIRYAHTNIIAHDWKKLMEFYVTVFACVPTGPERDNRGPQIDEVTGVERLRARGRHLRLPGHGENGPTLEIFQCDPSVAAVPAVINRPGLGHLAFE